MRHGSTILAVLGLVVACNKGEKNEPAPSAKGTEKAGTAPAKTPAKTTSDASADVGINAGTLQRGAKEGPDGAITAVQGTVSVRRLGETKLEPAKADMQLHAGDVIVTGEQALAQITLADESVIELAEVSTLAIASRHGAADPASGAAVLSGVARFTVSPRAPAEGAFRVYTPAGVALAKGTIFGVGVAASGQARVGVESGAVDVIGLAALDAKPVAVEGGAHVILAAAGDVTSPSPWPADEWGTWRDEADAKIDASAAIEAHAAAMTKLSAGLAEAYAELSASADAAATFESTAAASATANEPARYEAALPDGAATIDASFALAGRVELLTWAFAAHATLATELYVRHPTKVEGPWAAAAPHVDAAILWPKRFEVTAVGYLEPLRLQYYVHHPRGRAHATLVGITVPDFYAKISAPAIDPDRVRGRVKTKIWMAPEVRFTAMARPVWVAAPAPDWRAKVKVTAAPPRAGVAFYARPPTLGASVLVGVNPSASWISKLTVSPPEPRANLRAAWSVPIGMKVAVGAPDLALAAKARAGIKLDAAGRLDANLKDYGATPDVDVKGKAKGDARAKVDARVGVGVKAPDIRIEAPRIDVKGKLDAGMKAGAGAQGAAGAGVDAKAKAGAGVKVKAPEVKVKTPEVKVKGEAKGKIKLGL